MIETLGELHEEHSGIIHPQEWMFDKKCTGKFSIKEISGDTRKRFYFLIFQEVERKKWIFFTERKFIPMTELITYSSDKAQIILELVEDLYKPIKRDKLLSKVLS